MAFFTSAIDTLKILVIALGALLLVIAAVVLTGRKKKKD